MDPPFTLPPRAPSDTTMASEPTRSIRFSRAIPLVIKRGNGKSIHSKLHWRRFPSHVWLPASHCVKHSRVYVWFVYSRAARVLATFPGNLGFPLHRFAMRAFTRQLAIEIVIVALLKGWRGWRLEEICSERVWMETGHSGQTVGKTLQVGNKNILRNTRKQPYLKGSMMFHANFSQNLACLYDVYIHV